MNVLVFKTNLEDQSKIRSVEPLLNNFKGLSDWSVDIEDIDKVLRLVVQNGVKELDLKEALQEKGILCEELED